MMGFLKLILVLSGTADRVDTEQGIDTHPASTVDLR